MTAFLNHFFGKPIAGTCAGLMLLAAGVAHAGPPRPEFVDLTDGNGPSTQQSPWGGAAEDVIGAVAVRDASGNVYGTTASGGRYNRGTVYRLAPDGTKTILHVFAGGVSDGATPVGNLVLGEAGRLYGTTRAGGAAGCGTVFEISAAGERILHAFTPGEGTPSLGVLHADTAGNLYGATSGDHEALYRLTVDGTLTILFQFA